MRENDDRRAVTQPLDILRKPPELLIAKHAQSAGLTQRPRGEDTAAADRPDHAGADPGHTLEKSATVNAVAIDLRFLVIHVLSPVHVHFTMILPLMWG